MSDLEPPACASKVQVLMIDYMDKVIDSYLAFMSDETDYEVSQKTRIADYALNKFVREFSKLKTGESPYD